MRRVSTAYDRLINAMAVAGASVLVLMAFWISYEALMRRFLNAPTVWVNDLSEYSLLWVTFLGAPWLVREGGHVQIDILLVRLSPRQRALLGVVGAAVAAVASAVLLWQGIDATLDAFRRGQSMARTWAVPRWLVWSIIPVGSFFLLIEWLRAAVRCWRAARSEQPPEAPPRVDHVTHQAAT